MGELFVFVRFECELVLGLGQSLLIEFKLIFKFLDFGESLFGHFGEPIVFLGQEGDLLFVLVDLFLHVLKLLVFVFKFKLGLF